VVQAAASAASVSAVASGRQADGTRESKAMGWILLEAFVALFLAVFIVWWTMSPRKKPAPPAAERDKDAAS
jgi:hypothetical protein